MGMFDSVIIYMAYPKCGRYDSWDWQTKDLDCVMFTYHPLPENWGANEHEKKLRKNLPVFKKFPLDKEDAVWVNQAERIEAEATLGEPYNNQLKYVNVYTQCDNCKAWFKGHISVIDGKLKLPLTIIDDKLEEI